MTESAILLSIIFCPMFAALIHSPVARRNKAYGSLFALCATTFTFALCLWLAPGGGSDLRLLPGLSFIPLSFRADGFRALYACVSGFLWTAAALYSLEYFRHGANQNRYWAFNLFTLGAVMGVFFSADLATTFLFFELMSFSSYAMVAHDESPAALRAAETYLAIALIGGLAMLTGMLLLWRLSGTLVFDELYAFSAYLPDKSSLYLPGALLASGFCAKAGVFPLHVWLPKAHPVAPAPASALLSGILIKTGVFGVVVVSAYLFQSDLAWSCAMLALAALTMLLGAVLALFSNDLKRTLACSSVSQIGFILSGIALLGLLDGHGDLAARGALLHMVNHSLMKLLLFSSAGVVYVNRHDLNLNRIRGFGRGKPLYFFIFLMGALGLSGVPLWSGYISKTLLHESLVEAIYLYKGQALASALTWFDYIFLFTGGLTLSYMMKLFFVLFVDKGKHAPEPAYIRPPSAFVLALTAVLPLILGSFPQFMDHLADWGQDFFLVHGPAHAEHYFSLKNLKGAGISTVIGVAVYFLVVRVFMMRRARSGQRTHADLWPKWMDLENTLYRPALKIIFRILALFAHLALAFPDLAARFLIALASSLAHFAATLPDLAARRLISLASTFVHIAEVLPDALFRLPFRHSPGLDALTGQPDSPALPADQPVIGGFSFGLLFAGLGAAVVLLSLFFRVLLGFS